MITLSGFPDEALAPWPAQVRMAAGAGLTHVEVRRVGVRGALSLSERALARAEAPLAAHGVRVACLATGLGKVPLGTPFAPQADALRRAAALAHRLDAATIRVFSWRTRTPEADRSRILDRMGRFAALARAEGVTLVHENEKGTFGSTPERCLDLVRATGGGLRLILDPANFVQCGVRPCDEAWPLLAPYVDVLHAKDARAATGRVVPVGSGDGQWPALAAALAASGWEGVVALEPHLGLGGRGGPISPARWLRALGSLRTVLSDAGVRTR